jgi:predicted secreted protein
MVKKQRILILISLIVLILPIIFACSIARTKNLSINESYSGKQVDVPVGGVLKVTLESGVVEGYPWNELTTIDNDQVIKQTAYEYKPSVPSMPEVGFQVWTFKAVGIGTAKLSNEYCEIVGSQRIKTFSLVVLVR